MDRIPFANAALLRSWSCPEPDRCPYCPVDAPRHWTHAGRYWRYAGDPDEPSRRTDVSRYKCKIVGRTFSIPPDALLPYCGIRTGAVLEMLRALLVQGIALNALARQAHAPRGTLRSLRARFLRVMPRLRLPWREGALGAADFLAALAAAGAAAVAHLFLGWKQREPKLSVLGVYAR